MAINVTAKQSYVALPLTSDDLPEVLNQVANANDPSEFATAREQIAEAYGSYGIPQPVQQALNAKEEAFKAKPASEVAFINLLKNVKTQVSVADGTQAGIDRITNALANAQSLTDQERVQVKDALVSAFTGQGVGVPNQVQQFLRSQWNGKF